jgi:hypothetical protein
MTDKPIIKSAANIEKLKDSATPLTGKGSGKGGSRKGAGRPKGSKNIYSQDSVKKLESLKFDPIYEMVKQVEQIDKDLVKTYINKDGEKMPCIRLGSGAHAQLIATRGTLINNLMQYGYKKVEKVEKEGNDVKPMSISFSFNEDFKPEDM